MANDEQQQPDTREPSDERKAELEAAYELQKDTDAPYQGVKIRTLGEMQWIVAQRRWLMEPLLGGGLDQANLSGADIDIATVSSANFFSANLSGASLHSANLNRGDLFAANLSGARLVRANLSETTLNWANLSMADLDTSNLNGASLSDANLSSSFNHDGVKRGADTNGEFERAHKHV